MDHIGVFRTIFGIVLVLAMPIAIAIVGKLPLAIPMAIVGKLPYYIMPMPIIATVEKSPGQ